ncbi:ES1 protein homolog, mitochondrial-like [Clytia hemisphaerica]|uniref:ES1 protein homolog, mitochondrial-like n=1 Tax=Clytia hemisphaerica TaxID=252671 RepID=UPI0034D4B8D2
MLKTIQQRLSTQEAHIILKRLMATKANPIVAVVLAGSGVYDGSEVHEASAVMVNLTRNNAEYKIYAPDVDQMHVVNHTNGEEMKETRNVFVESARIARGAIEKLDQLDSSKCDAVIFPGGFGAAKNLSNFAVKNAECTVNEQVEKVIKDFHSSSKPIGLCCIAPVLAARTIQGCELTMGQDDEQGGKFPYAGACGAATAMGAKHINKNVDEVHVDATNKIVTTPAYMCDTKVHEIHDGVGKMVQEVLKMIS